MYACDLVHVQDVFQALASVGSVLKWLESLHGGRMTAALQRTLQCEASKVLIY